GYVAVLPILAELDPAFAAQALDGRRLVAAVEGDTALTAAERVRQQRVLSGRSYAGCLCHGLAPGLEALANNGLAGVRRAPGLAGGPRRPLLGRLDAEGPARHPVPQDGRPSGPGTVGPAKRGRLT